VRKRTPAAETLGVSMLLKRKLRTENCQLDDYSFRYRRSSQRKQERLLRRGA